MRPLQLTRLPDDRKTRGELTSSYGVGNLPQNIAEVISEEARLGYVGRMEVEM
jgi:hypothetical protein